MRTTTKDLENIVERLNKLRGFTKAPLYYLEKAYGQYCVEFGDPVGTGSKVSPRLPTGELFAWLQAYQDGLEHGIGHLWARMKSIDPFVLQVIVSRGNGDDLKTLIEKP